MPGTLLGQLAQQAPLTGYDTVNLVGRQLSALADLLTIILVYAIAMKLYGRKVAILTAVFSTFAVLQIQLSHFFTVETYTNFFIFLAIYFGVSIATYDSSPGYDHPPSGASHFRYYAAHILKDRLFWNTLGFGLAYGMAMASKINSFPLALLLPGAFTILYFRTRDNTRSIESPSGAEAEPPLEETPSGEIPPPSSTAPVRSFFSWAVSSRCCPSASSNRMPSRANLDSWMSASTRCGCGISRNNATRPRGMWTFLPPCSGPTARSGIPPGTW
jgi:hypothetical protein